MERMRSDEDRNGDGQLQDADADTVARAGADAWYAASLVSRQKCLLTRCVA